jgi:hypothetical protein
VARRSEPGDLTVAVQGQNLPHGTPVRLRVTASNSALAPPNTALTTGTASLGLTVPKEDRTLHAFADLTPTSP